MTTPALEFHAVSKSFPGVQALDSVSFDVRPGEVHALLGENGAGKSTLLRVLAGDYQPDSGYLSLAGEHAGIASPREAHRLGVQVIYQEPNLAPSLSVAENIFMGHLPVKARRVDWPGLHRATARRADKLGLTVDPTRRVWSLGVAQRQVVEILKALESDVRILALDEPTASLSATEVGMLFALIRRLREDGVAVIYVSHRMEEIRAISDRVTVLRDGRTVDTLTTSAVADARLIMMMIGRTLMTANAPQPGRSGNVALTVRELVTDEVGPVSLQVKAGEIVGLAGLVGSGRSRVTKALSGTSKARSGTIEVSGAAVRIRGPADSIRAGIAICPQDRKALALVPDRSIAENIALGGRAVPPRAHVLSRRREAAVVREYLTRLDIRPADPSRLVRTLSGGNQQKVVLARWLAQSPAILVLDEPTRGVDVGAKSELYALLRDLAAAGVGLLVASSDLVELLGLCDRMYVMRDGEISGEVARADATEESLLRLAMKAPAPAGRSHQDG
ncbi:MAG: ATP-binding cassette domain-containing protein [Propionibacteriales bacterium]|nr:ATP-binding cassette domain-containing protein [Propionibacteriales bacterium]